LSAAERDEETLLEGYEMKKILYLILTALIILSGVSCGETLPEETLGTKPSESKVTTERNEGAGETASSTAEETEERHSFFVFRPNDSFDGLVKETVTADKLDCDTVLNELIKRKVLTSDSAVKEFNADNGAITADFNEAFGRVICSMGTIGEMLVMGSVVNTFLDAFDCETFSFTVEGKTLESGHVIYDFPMSFFTSDEK